MSPCYTATQRNPAALLDCVFFATHKFYQEEFYISFWSLVKKSNDTELMVQNKAYYIRFLVLIKFVVKSRTT